MLIFNSTFVVTVMPFALCSPSTARLHFVRCTLIIVIRYECICIWNLKFSAIWVYLVPSLSFFYPQTKSFIGAESWKWCIEATTIIKVCTMWMNQKCTLRLQSNQMVIALQIFISILEWFREIQNIWHNKASNYLKDKLYILWFKIKRFTLYILKCKECKIYEWISINLLIVKKPRHYFKFYADFCV